jgi:histidinol-phosphate phosphatase family protein
VRVDLVVPTVGRPSLGRMLRALAAGDGPPLGRVIVVDDRPGHPPALELPPLGNAAAEVRVARSGGRGPAAARNRGWRLAEADWVAFLDDDVLPPADWRARLHDDLAGLPGEVAASQGVIAVPRPPGRRPTDWERGVIGLEGARWATADMAYRRDALRAVGGFDERFGRAFREDADLALRVLASGGRLVRGGRRIVHPVGPGARWASLRAQAGNADDVLMRALHGPAWRERAGAPRGRRRRHLATAALGAAAAGAALLGRRRTALAAGLGWGLATAELAAARIAPGPRTPAETTLMTVTSVAMPFAAAWHTGRGLARRRRLLADRLRAPRPRGAGRVPRAVLFDRDGTLVHDEPYNGDPERVRPVDGAAEALARLRRAGVATAVISNQSGIARGMLTPGQVAEVNRRIAELVGDPGPWLMCPHGPDDGCACRKPRPGMVLEAAATLGVAPADCLVIGDIGADVEAARAAGARAVLVPTPATRREEIAAAPVVAPDLLAAIDIALEGAA